MENYPRDNKKLAFKVTLHCTMGCGIGDTLGLIIGTLMGWPVFPTMILAIGLGFAGGYSLAIIPLLKNNISLMEATKVALVSETASIAVMEVAENATAFLIPGLLTASFLTFLFWLGFLVSVVAGFVAAYPVNYFMITRGLKRGHCH